MFASASFKVMQHTWPVTALVAMTTSTLGAENAARHEARVPEPGPIREATHAASIERGEAAIKSMMETIGIPGLSIAIARDGQAIWSEGFGVANRETGAVVSRDTRFRLGSVSKLVTATAVGRLVQEGRLDLDAPVQTYVADFPQKSHPITARQLAGHLAGIRHYQAGDYAPNHNIDRLHFDSVREGLSIFEHDALRHQPGTRYAYSTFGYSLLSAVVEGASDRPFLDYLDDAIFRPLNMTGAAGDDPKADIPERTAFYQLNTNPTPDEAPFVDPSYKWGGGGLVATADDLVRLGAGYLDPAFLDAATVEMMMTSQSTSDGVSTGVGIGWRVGADPWGRRIWHHAGSMSGCRAVLLVYPEEKVVIAMLSNLSSQPLMILETAQFLARPYLANLPEHARRVPDPRPLDTEVRFKLRGTMTGSPVEGSLTYTIQQKGGVRGTMQVGPLTMAVLDVRDDATGLRVDVVSRFGIIPITFVDHNGTRRAEQRFPGGQTIDLRIETDDHSN